MMSFSSSSFPLPMIRVGYETWKAIIREDQHLPEESEGWLLYDARGIVFACNDKRAFEEQKEFCDNMKKMEEEWKKRQRENEEEEGLFEEMEREAEREMEKFRREEDRAIRVLAGGEEWEEEKEEQTWEEEE